jgi:ADP-heptose:LPS heptosyltransferase
LSSPERQREPGDSDGRGGKSPRVGSPARPSDCAEVRAKQRTRVAIVRLDALGDTLLSTPAIDYLQREVGPSNVLVLVSPGMGRIFGDAIPFQEVPPGEAEAQIAARLDEFAPDIVFVFSEKKRALRAAHLSKAPQKIGFDPGWSQPIRSLEVKRFLTMRFPIVNSLDSASRYHEVERYCRLVGKGLSHKFINGAGLRLFSLGERPASPSPDAPLGFQWTRKWLHGNWAETLLPALLNSTPLDTTIFVAPEERDWAMGLIPQERHGCVASHTDLVDYARAVAGCRYLVSIDTGAVHIAAAVGTPVVDVFPESGAQHTVPRWRPWMVPHQVVLKPALIAGQAELLHRLDQGREAMESVLEWRRSVSAAAAR